MLAVFIGFVAFIFMTRSPKGSDPIAVRFLTDKVQASKKDDIVIFSKDTLEQPGFKSQLESTQKFIREGGFTEKPELVRPRKNSGSFERRSAYKVCRPDGGECVYFVIDVFGQAKSGNSTSRIYYVDSYKAYASESEATGAYDQ